MEASRGFTLIELMVVVAIIAATMAIVVPKIAGRGNEVKQVLRDITALSRELHQRAKLTGSTYRIVIDLADGAGGKVGQTYWVEKSDGSTLAKPGEETLKPEKDRDGKPKKISNFAPDPTIFKKPKSLPSNLHFEKIELSRLRDPILTGKAFIHYMPQGLVEESAIHLKGDLNHQWTIAIHPLTGKAEVILESKSLKDLESQ